MDLGAGGIVNPPTVPVVRLARYEMHPAHVAEHLIVVVRRLRRIPWVRVGRPRTLEVDRSHPIAQEAVGIAEHGPRQHDELVDDTVVGPVLAYKLVRVCGTGGLVERVYEIHAHSLDFHMLFTSFSRTLE